MASARGMSYTSLSRVLDGFAGMSYGMRNLLDSTVSYCTAKSTVCFRTAMAWCALPFERVRSHSCTAAGRMLSTGVRDHFGAATSFHAFV